ASVRTRGTTGGSGRGMEATGAAAAEPVNGTRASTTHAGPKRAVKRGKRTANPPAWNDRPRRRRRRRRPSGGHAIGRRIRSAGKRWRGAGTARRRLQIRRRAPGSGTRRKERGDAREE